jgi:hypothetical protein
LTRWVNNFQQKCQFKSFDHWKLTLIYSPYKPELSMIRSCPNRLEFKNKCYSTVNQSITESAKNIDMGRTKTKPYLKRKKVRKLYFHFWPPKKCPPFFLIHTWWCENITASPCGVQCRRNTLAYSPRFLCRPTAEESGNNWHTALDSCPGAHEHSGPILIYVCCVRHVFF